MDLDERDRRQEHIESLSPTERGIFADMIMRSLRGSWGSPRRRAKMLELLSLTGEMEYYDPEDLQSRVEAYFQSIGRGHPDGRFWRGEYEEADVDLTVVDESTVRELASRIPDDRTWDDWKITKEFHPEEDDDD